MKKKLIVAACAAAAAAAAAWIYYVWSAPWYEPGMVRAMGTGLEPPVQTSGGDGGRWETEPGFHISHFADGSVGGTPVLVVHGGPGRPFKQPIKALQSLALLERFRFHYYDQRGCGESTRPIDRLPSDAGMYAKMQLLNRTLGLQSQLADIERIRRILGVSKLMLIGHSWGGFLASLYAAEFPEHVERLLLVSPAPMFLMPMPGGTDLFATVRTRLPQSEHTAYDEFMKDYMDFSAHFTRSDDELVALGNKFGEWYLQAIGAIPAQMTETGRPGGWMTWGMFQSLGLRHDYRRAMRAVLAPVLVVHGGADLQPEGATRQYLEVFPHASLTVIPNAGHFAFDDQPQEFTAVAEAFLLKNGP